MNEEDFKEKLKEILSSQHTLNVVHSILAQVKALGNSSGRYLFPPPGKSGTFSASS